jgi:hypothetical protein
MDSDDKGFVELRVRKPTHRWIVAVFLVGMAAVLANENYPNWLADLLHPDPPILDRRDQAQAERDGQSIGNPETREIAPSAKRVSYADMKPLLSDLQPLRKHRLCKASPRISATAYRAVPKDGVQSGIHIDAGHSIAKTWGLAIINLPVAYLWMAVNDEEAYPGTLPVTVSKIISGEPHKDGRYVFQKMSFPRPISDRWWIIHKNAGQDLYAVTEGKMWEACAANATNMSRVRGTSVEKYTENADMVNWTWAGWTLIPLSEHLTLVEYFSWTDPGGSVPAGPASRFAAGAVKRTMGKIELLASRYRPEDMARFTKPDGSPLSQPAEQPAEESQEQPLEQDGLGEPAVAEDVPEPPAP